MQLGEKKKKWEAIVSVNTKEHTIHPKRDRKEVQKDIEQSRQIRKKHQERRQVHLHH